MISGVLLGTKSYRFQSLQEACLGHSRAYQADCLLRGARGIGVGYPTVLLSNSCVLVEVRVQPGAQHRAAEGLLMQKRGTRTDDHSVKIVLPDIFFYRRLPRI